MPSSEMVVALALKFPKTDASKALPETTMAINSDKKPIMSFLEDFIPKTVFFRLIVAINAAMIVTAIKMIAVGITMFVAVILAPGLVNLPVSGTTTFVSLFELSFPSDSFPLIVIIKLVVAAIATPFLGFCYV
jgi:hypothetical protein